MYWLHRLSLRECSSIELHQRDCLDETQFSALLSNSYDFWLYWHPTPNHPYIPLFFSLFRLLCKRLIFCTFDKTDEKEEQREREQTKEKTHKKAQSKRDGIQLFVHIIRKIHIAIYFEMCDTFVCVCKNACAYLCAHIICMYRSNLCASCCVCLCVGEWVYARIYVFFWLNLMVVVVAACLLAWSSFRLRLISNIHANESNQCTNDTHRAFSLKPWINIT